MFTWIKELFILIGMIFSKTNVPKDIEIMKMKHFPFKSYSYMMWCGKLVTRKDITYDKIPKKDKNHEGGHIIQACRYKYWFQYYIIYGWEWLKGNPISSPSKSAYYTIPFEVQAYAKESDFGYDFNKEDLKNKYTLKNRKKLFKNYYKTPNLIEWKKYIKTL